MDVAFPESILQRLHKALVTGFIKNCTCKIITLDRLWRAARFTSTYKEDSSSSQIENFEDGLDFNQEDPEDLITIDSEIRRRVTEVGVEQIGQGIQEGLTPGRSERLPVDHFSPVVVRFPVNAPELRPPVMLAAVLVNFEDENGEDDGDRALQDANCSLSNLEWEDDNIPFFLQSG